MTVHKVTELWAYVIEDPDGNEGVPAVLINGLWYPLMGADRDRMTMLEPRARELAHNHGKRLELRRFTKVEAVAVIEP
jgi:hypothetical protein